MAATVLAGHRIPTGSHSGMCRGRGPDAGKGNILSSSGAVPDGQRIPTSGAKVAVEAESLFETMADEKIVFNLQLLCCSSLNRLQPQWTSLRPLEMQQG